MILTLTPNPALDITYAVTSVALGESHRVGSVSERAGGKGLNVAAVLTAMGRPAVAVAPVGELDTGLFASDLDARRVPHRLVSSPCPTRRSVAVVEADGRATLLNEPGFGQSQRVWDRLADELVRLAPDASVLTVSGSLPPGTDPNLVRRVTLLAREAGLRVVLDVSGVPLTRALGAAPELVKPNRVEAAVTLTGLGRGEVPSVPGAARALVVAGAGAAVVSDGTNGLVLVHEDVALRAHLRRPLSGNPTGAGDALTAALAADLEDGMPQGRDAWAAALRRGIAWSAAAVLQPVAGSVDPADVDRLLPTVEIEEIRP
ncbi:1-phosphofructokinase family hexose kinase [Terrabacter sp. MAHUQ-38]|uniref:1-phosphofructokinase family hexose kinase n=1 Tax=unclassified Terrabacter TaxID=2630222 RepID=UPI00165E8B1B|nr:hexose kinase [Terrabacter sp. MAHUQ-38]MBC9820236.1 hexose kinase [Terrabacter sp. MAHUQ-38]